jgi:hypothetical protein
MFDTKYAFKTNNEEYYDTGVTVYDSKEERTS